MLKTKSSATWQFFNDIDLICFSHLRWNFVFQRPQHLLSRFARYTRVFFIEEPIYHDAPAKLHIEQSEKNVWVVVPYLKKDLAAKQVIAHQKKIVNTLIAEKDIKQFVSWYYTPMALPFSNHLSPVVTVYDCMDELSAFKFAPAELKILEKELMKKADLVFTGGYSIYESKKNDHKHIFPFPSSIDKEHFAQARNILNDPLDQKNIPHPRFGFYGVIDERLDIELIGEVAKAKPDWQFIIIGPVVKIDPQSLPRLSNIHYLGGKNYKELPHYLAGWDVAMIPFAMNESTRFISPTKTPEYLAAGKPVISAPIRDVIAPYGENKLVRIAANAKQFIRHAETLLKRKNNKRWLTNVDAFLAGISWDKTWSQMAKHIEHKLKTSTQKTKEKEKVYV
ncbi:MAG: glycosyltransferase family 1 protein [Flavisolibacter sp.]|nr:glycosyltransferase family 1 protein [Flavisolibacter sp.]